jgi:hypothetical protein
VNVQSQSQSSSNEDEEEVEEINEDEDNNEFGERLLSSRKKLSEEKEMNLSIFRNKFFVPPGDSDGEERRRGRVYAAIEVPEPETDFSRVHPNESEPVFLECVDTSWFHAQQSSESSKLWTDIYQSAPLSVLELTRYSLPAFPDGAGPGDIAWFEFGYEPASGSDGDARIYTNLLSDGADVKISFHEPRPLGWQGKGPMGAQGWIEQAIAEQPSSSNSRDITDRFAALSVAGGVAFYDVGQGACQAAVDQSMHLPQLYVDLGGGVLTNRKTFPEDFGGFCFTANPIVILSHWDWDHWSSAQRYPEALNASWLTPPVPMKPIQQAFAAELYARGSLHIWNHTWPATIIEGPVTIERCTGRTANDSGLSVTLRQKTNGKRNCLLPGDAAYAHIPSVVAGESFSVLGMTHHGGRLHSAIYPKPKRSSSSVLSVGPRNSYRHPLFSTIAAHLENGWGFPTGTAVSGQRPCHVLVPWGSQPHIFQGGCHGGGGCATAIAAIAPAHTKVTAFTHALPPKAARRLVTA